jgi:hypothetical protein
MRSFRLLYRPMPLAEVSDRFHLTPLIRAMTSSHDLFVQALTEKGMRLVRVFLPPMRIHIPALPKDAEGRAPRNDQRNWKGHLQGSEAAMFLLYNFGRKQTLRCKDNARSSFQNGRPAIDAHDRIRLISIIGGMSCPRPSIPPHRWTKVLVWEEITVGKPGSGEAAHRQLGIAQNHRFDGAYGLTIRGDVRVPRKLRMRRTGPRGSKIGSVIIRGPRRLAPARPSLGRKRPRGHCQANMILAVTNHIKPLRQRP